jgi:hypothetical protein
MINRQVDRWVVLDGADPDLYRVDTDLEALASSGSWYYKEQKNSSKPFELSKIFLIC